MNRELKFREFNHNRMDYRPSISGSCINDAFSKDRNLMQFVGKKDKKGKEIYDKDICSAKFGKKILLGEIIFTEFEWLFKSNENSVFNKYRFDELSEIEVIGNIYENPELLSE